MRCIWVLEVLGNLNAVEPIITTLDDPSPVVRTRAVYALMMLGDSRAVEPLFRRLHDSEVFIRVLTIHAIGRLGNSQALEVLIGLLSKKEAMQVNIAIFRAIIKIGNKRFMELLILAMVNEDISPLIDADFFEEPSSIRKLSLDELKIFLEILRKKSKKISKSIF